MGVFWFVVAGFCFALNFIFAKLLYQGQPDLLPLQLLTYRGIISSIIMLITVNRNLKHVVWDSINGAQWFDVDTPFGGYGQSGVGRENGVAGFEEYLETKVISLPKR